MPQAQYCSITLAAERYLRHRYLALACGILGYLAKGRVQVACSIAIKYLLCVSEILEYCATAPRILGYWKYCEILQLSLPTESTHARNPRSRRIVSSTPRNRSISVRLLAPTLAILHLLGLRAAPLPR